VVRFQNNVPTPASIPAAWPAFGPILFPLKSDAPRATMPGARVNLDFVNEHEINDFALRRWLLKIPGSNEKGEACDLARKRELTTLAI
jgi:hypothetical protein